MRVDHIYVSPDGQTLGAWIHSAYSMSGIKLSQLVKRPIYLSHGSMIITLVFGI